jgi:alpha-tubulin suppressor-like RCC1 family protein
VGIAGIEQAISVQTGALHGCALDRDGAVWCWGHNEQRQLGAEAPWFSAKPQVVGGLPAITRLALGYSFSCALDQDGAVWCWGQLPGNVGAEAQAKPQKMSLPPATELVAGWQHVCARTTDKDVYCWGSGEQGQLGNGQTSDSTSPVLAAHVVEMSLSAGDDLTCASGDGTLTCWGRLGDRFAGVASQVSPSPTTLPAGAAVVQVALGYDFSCSRSGSGAVVCQGQSAQLQLGVWPDISEPLGPVGVSLPEPAASVVAGGSHACALLASGNAVCWGDNGSGQLGAGFDAPFAGPFAVAW